MPLDPSLHDIFKEVNLHVVTHSSCGSKKELVEFPLGSDFSLINRAERSLCK